MLNSLKYRFRVFARIRPLVDKAGSLFFVSALMKTVMIAVSVALPFFFGIFIEDVVLGKQFRLLYLVAAAYLGLKLISVLASMVDLRCNLKINNQLLYKIRKCIMDGLFRQDFPSYERLNLGDTKMLLDNDTTKLTDFVSGQTADSIVQTVKIALLTGLLFALEWRLALFSVVVIPLTFVFDGYIGKREKGPNADLRKNDKSWDGWLYGTVSGWREVRVNNMERREEREFFRYTHKDAVVFSRWNNFWITRRQLFPKLKDEFFMQFCLYLLGGYLIYQNHMTIGILLVFAQYYAELSNSVKTLSTYEADLLSNQVYYDRVLDELDAVAQRGALRTGGIAAIPSFDITMENVTFKYPEGKQNVIDGFNLSIKQGERVAIVGESGRGKTTLLKLLTGMAEAQEGSVCYGDVDIRSMDLDELHKHIGFVPQENFLFNATIKENLLYGKEDATDDEIRNACKKAYIDEFVESLPNKYDSVIGEKGIKLSGGQRQRIVLARLFLRDVDVFMLDEATSAIDQYSESIIQQAIHEIAGDKTIIVVAHRQSSIDICDRVVRL